MTIDNYSLFLPPQVLQCFTADSANMLTVVAFFGFILLSIVTVQGQGINGNNQLAEPVFRSKTCRFGRPRPGTCQCPAAKQGKPVCGSDLETYKNDCEFQCALSCNPTLEKYDGACPKGGGLPQKPRLNLTTRDKKKSEVEENGEEIAE